MSTAQAIVQKVRRRLHDYPDHTFTQNNPLAAAGTTFTPPTADANKIARPGALIEWDDGTDEIAEVTAFDAAVPSWTLVRGMFGTTAAQHALNSVTLINPRIRYADVVEVANEVIDTELWPHVWVAGESTLTYQSTNEYYSPTPTGIAEIVYAYQLSGGRQWPLHTEWIPPTLADDTNFPRGAVKIRNYADATTVYYAYRARAALATLTGSLEHIVVLGVLAQLLADEEGLRVAPDVGQLRGKVQEGAAARAGAVARQRFEQARMNERISLLHEEAQRTQNFTMGR